MHVAHIIAYYRLRGSLHSLLIARIYVALCGD
ncbi:hypothetical protein ACVI1K_005088 [Bradyrhizobium sp. USDA 4508]